MASSGKSKTTNVFEKHICEKGKKQNIATEPVEPRGDASHVASTQRGCCMRSDATLSNVVMTIGADFER